MNAPLEMTGKPDSSPPDRRVAIITGGSQGIGAGLVSGFRRKGYAVVASSRSIGAAEEDDYVTVRGDIAEAYLVASAERSGVDTVASFDRSIDRVTTIKRIEPGTYEAARAIAPRQSQTDIDRTAER
jgi:NAD(P)-dependent dehydrogenase (short-subunit alcohol dehydrogenase family)